MEGSQVSRSIEIHSKARDYKAQFVDNFEISLQERLRPGDVIILDKNVFDLYKKSFDHITPDVMVMLLNATEEQKSYEQIAPIIDQLIGKGFRKNNRLIAIGGGITQDVTGFTASILFRGVEWLFFPTTLLAQGDSCIGSKTSINFGRYKNQLGNFYPPSEVIIDLRFLDTLADREIRSGLGEMMHYFILASEEDFHRIQREYSLSLKDNRLLAGLIARCLEIKKGFIEIDEYDKAERRILNYGHSFGHAIEGITDYRVPHGIAVSYGMDIANYISEKLGYISEELRQEIRDLLAMNWTGIPLGEIDLEAFTNALRKDKKNIGSDVRVILMRGLGKTFITSLELNQTTMQWLETYFKSQP
jgi:3-dehydroquinate synthase